MPLSDNQINGSIKIMNEKRKRILSGIQSSGALHLGNYFGAMRQHIAMQDEGDCFYFVADLHALTTVYEPERVRELVRGVALDYLALGLDPEKVTFYRQSDVAEVCELAWTLGCGAGMGLLERAHSYKDKVAQGIVPSVGLFYYPVLMAADILLYKAHEVPVGPDQKQHLEMTRDMAGTFNNRYGETFPLPEPIILDATPVPGLDGRKMSKSYGNTINIFMEDSEYKRLIMKKIVTDSTPVEEPKDKDQVVFHLFSLFATPEEKADMAERFEKGGVGYGEVKKFILNRVKEKFSPAREKRKDLEAKPQLVDEILAAGAEKAKKIAKETLAEVREKTGIK